MERIARARPLGQNPQGEAMGEIRVRVKLSNAADDEYARQGRIAPADVRTFEAEAVVDTVAVTSVIPRSVLERLGVSTPSEMVMQYADGRSESVPVSNAICFELLDRRTIDDGDVPGRRARTPVRYRCGLRPRRRAAGVVGARQEPVLAADGDALQGPLGRVVVDVEESPHSKR